MKKRISLTTTLPYVNADPHIGFALEIVQADIVARHYRSKGYDVFFNTGTDEHGTKIYRKALEAKQDPQAYVDAYAAKFDRLKSALNLSYNNFIRTSDPAHVAAAQEFWRRCDANGDIYTKLYAIKYCVGCELEKTESELKDGRCILHPNLEIEVLKEENYFFRFSKYQQPLLDLYRKRPDFVVPAHRLNEIRSFVEQGVQDFSISRLKEKLPWGVPVPGDDAHVMYVWFDALINYISALGWPDKKFSEWWPSVQFAGKDNLRQQAAMWQAMLLSAGIEPSKQIVIHGFITSNGQKMSKSAGNVIDPFALVEKYGSDAVRYYLARHVNPFEDSDFTVERFEAAYTADLANGLGNLLSRVTTMVAQYLDGAVQDPQAKVRTGIEKHMASIGEAIERYEFAAALEEAWKLIGEMDAKIQEKKPWEMAKSRNTEELARVLSDLTYGIRRLTEELEPVLPDTASKVLPILRADRVTKIPPLFPRVP